PPKQAAAKPAAPLPRPSAPLPQAAPPVRQAPPVSVAAPPVAPVEVAAPLPPPPPRSYEVPASSGMSFLGLDSGTSSSSSSAYLLDEEPQERTYGRFITILIVLALGGLLAWQWRHNGFPFNQLAQQNQNTTAAPAEQTAQQTP